MSESGAIDPEGEVRDEDDPGEVPTSFATKGIGWSGRDDEEDEDDQQA